MGAHHFWRIMGRVYSSWVNIRAKPGIAHRPPWNRGTTRLTGGPPEGSLTFRMVVSRVWKSKSRSRSPGDLLSTCASPGLSGCSWPKSGDTQGMPRKNGKPGTATSTGLLKNHNSRLHPANAAMLRPASTQENGTKLF